MFMLVDTDEVVMLGFYHFGVRDGQIQRYTQELIVSMSSNSLKNSFNRFPDGSSCLFHGPFFICFGITFHPCPPF